MRVLAVIVMLVLLAVVLGFVMAAFARVRHRYLAGTGRIWRRRESTLTNGAYQVYVQRGAQIRSIGRAIEPGLPPEEFADRLAQRRSDADQEAATLNAGLPR